MRPRRTVFYQPKRPKEVSKGALQLWVRMYHHHGWTAHALYRDLKLRGRKVGRGRVYRMWNDHVARCQTVPREAAG
jgi:hypothetical protein